MYSIYSNYLHYPYCEWSALIYYETLCIMTSPRGNRFQPQIDCVQNRGTFLWTVINKTSGEIIRSKIDSFRTSNIWAQKCTVIKKVRTFFGPWGRDRSKSPPCWIFWVKQIHQSTESEKTTRLHYKDVFLYWKAKQVSKVVIKICPLCLRRPSRIMFAVYTVFYPVIMPADPCYVLILVGLLHSLYICILIYFRWTAYSLHRKEL